MSDRTLSPAADALEQRGGLLPYLPSRCRCGARAQLGLVLLVASNGSLQARLKRALCGVEGSLSVPHQFIHPTDHVRVARDNRESRPGLTCECGAIVATWPVGPAPGELVGACRQCLTRFPGGQRLPPIADYEP